MAARQGMFWSLKKTTETDIMDLELCRAVFWRLIKDAQDIIAMDPVSRLNLRFAPIYATGESLEKVSEPEINTSMKFVSIIFE
jgi:hypothetical protein